MGVSVAVHFSWREDTQAMELGGVLYFWFTRNSALVSRLTYIITTPLTDRLLSFKPLLFILLSSFNPKLLCYQRTSRG